MYLSTQHMFILQVAAYADNHLCVRKGRDPGGRIQTTVAALDGVNERAQEIAAMLGGEMLVCIENRFSDTGHHVRQEQCSI